jgi:hypothetical protein
MSRTPPAVVVVTPSTGRLRRYVGKHCTHEVEILGGLNGDHRLDIFLYRRIPDALATPHGPFEGMTFS